MTHLRREAIDGEGVVNCDINTVSSAVANAKEDDPLKGIDKAVPHIHHCHHRQCHLCVYVCVCVIVRVREREREREREKEYV